MKHFLILPLLLLNLYSSAQEWKERYVTAEGDTIKPGSKIKIVEDKSYQYIMPSLYNISGTPYNAPRNERNKRFLTIDMSGNTFTVQRLTRVKTSSGYTEVAVLLIGDKSMSAIDNTEFNIYIDKAIKAGEIKPMN